jgi:hypothetical protein
MTAVNNWKTPRNAYATLCAKEKGTLQGVAAGIEVSKFGGSTSPRSVATNRGTDKYMRTEKYSVLVRKPQCGAGPRLVSATLRYLL